MAKEEIKKEIKDFLEFNKMKAQRTQIWHTMKAVLRGKLVFMSAFKKKLERVHTSSLMAQLKALEQQQQQQQQQQKKS